MTTMGTDATHAHVRITNNNMYGKWTECAMFGDNCTFAHIHTLTSMKKQKRAKKKWKIRRRRRRKNRTMLTDLDVYTRLHIVCASNKRKFSISLYCGGLLSFTSHSAALSAFHSQIYSSYLSMSICMCRMRPFGLCLYVCAHIVSCRNAELFSDWNCGFSQFEYHFALTIIL